MIGLDTGHLVYNYGTKLQAYAMQTILESYGEQVEIIQWHKKDFGPLNSLYDHVRMMKKAYSRYGFKISYFFKALSRYRAIESFNPKYHIHKFYGNFSSIKCQTQIYSMAFCGSDQAWLPDNVRQHIYTLESFDDNIFKAAYAPSFGIDTINDEYKSSYVSFLNKINAISVREISAQKIIKDLLDKEVPVVLDPTLLMDHDEWEKLRRESNISLPFNDKYIFCYFLGDNPAHRKAAKRYAKCEGFKIVNLQHFFSFCKADENFADCNLYKVTPQDFIQLISNSEMICTDSFHCTAFSIMYQKKFCAFHRFAKNDKASTNSRLYSLLGQLGLEQRIVQDDKDVINDDINYSVVNSNLEELRKSSWRFLDQIFKGN